MNRKALAVVCVLLGAGGAALLLVLLLGDSQEPSSEWVGVPQGGGTAPAEPVVPPGSDTGARPSRERPGDAAPSPDARSLPAASIHAAHASREAQEELLRTLASRKFFEGYIQGSGAAPPEGALGQAMPDLLSGIEALAWELGRKHGERTSGRGDGARETAGLVQAQGWSPRIDLDLNLGAGVERDCRTQVLDRPLASSLLREPRKESAAGVWLAEIPRGSVLALHAIKLTVHKNLEDSTPFRISLSIGEQSGLEIPHSLLDQIGSCDVTLLWEGSCALSSWSDVQIEFEAPASLEAEFRGTIESSQYAASMNKGTWRIVAGPRVLHGAERLVLWLRSGGWYRPISVYATGKYYDLIPAPGEAGDVSSPLEPGERNTGGCTPAVLLEGYEFVLHSVHYRGRIGTDPKTGKNGCVRVLPNVPSRTSITGLDPVLETDSPGAFSGIWTGQWRYVFQEGSALDSLMIELSGAASCEAVFEGVARIRKQDEKDPDERAGEQTPPEDH